MADGTKIEWTDATWNPITGCSIVSPGCTNCYAMKLAGTRLKHIPSRAGLTRDTKAGPVWTGEVRLNAEWLDQPLRWKAPRMIFVCAHGDLFAEGVPDEWIDRVFAVMALAPHHTFQVLTKRAERMRDYLLDERTPGRIARQILDLWLEGSEYARAAMAGDRWPVRTIGDIDDPDDVTIDLPLPNVWLGVSAEDQKRADERVPLLLDTPATVRWVSAEPLLGPLNLEPWLAWEDDELPNGETWGCPGCEDSFNGGGGCDCPNRKAVFSYEEGPVGDDGSPQWIAETRVTLDWIVAGGESGNGARPMHPDWVRSIRDQCAAAEVAFLFKQWGAWSGHAVLDGGRLEPTIPASANFKKLRVWRENEAFPYPLETPASEVFKQGNVIALPIGKKAAGRLLDGVTHDAFPHADEVPFG